MRPPKPSSHLSPPKPHPVSFTNQSCLSLEIPSSLETGCSSMAHMEQPPRAGCGALSAHAPVRPPHPDSQSRREAFCSHMAFVELFCGAVTADRSKDSPSLVTSQCPPIHAAAKQGCFEACTHHKASEWTEDLDPGPPSSRLELHLFHCG